MKDLNLAESLNLDMDQNLTFFWGPGSELNGEMTWVGQPGAGKAGPPAFTPSSSCQMVTFGRQAKDMGKA